MASVGVGIDVSKDWLDVATTTEGPAWRVRNNNAGLDKLLGQLVDLDVHRVVLEASGGYEALALHALHAAGQRVVLVQPMRARHFARALNRKAKTDAIDAQVLAHMAKLAVDETPLWEPVEEVIADLRALVERRQQLLALRDGEKKRLRFARDIVRADIEASVALLKSQIAGLEDRIDALVASSPRVTAEVEVLESVRGVGRVTATTLRVLVPELGTLTRREVAALVGVAPINRDSGTKSGRRYIQGGRRAARRCLYMAALAAGRWNEFIRAQYKRLVERGKKPKVAIVANMRKLLIHLNSRMRSHLQGPTGAVPQIS